MPRLQYAFLINVYYIGLEVIANAHNCRQYHIEQLTVDEASMSQDR